jgi:ribosome-binding factor A
MKHRESSSFAGHRHVRLQECLFEELTSLLRHDVEDPELEAVRVEAVALSVDYRHARVHFTLIGVPDSADVRRAALSALERAKAFLRRELALAIDMKRLPDLGFVCDGVLPAASEPERGDEDGQVDP